MGVKFGTEEGTFGPLLRAKFHPHRCNVLPLRGEKPQNWPLSKLNTGRFALRAMLPVIMTKLKPKNGDAQKKRSGREVRGASPEAGNPDCPQWRPIQYRIVPKKRETESTIV